MAGRGLINQVSIPMPFFRHDYFTALEGVSFTIKKGETLGIVGTNGSGKSTLLKVPANIYSVDSGIISWRCRQVSLLALSLGFDVELSGRDNAIISGMLLGGRKKEVLEKLDEIVEFSELEGFIDSQSNHIPAVCVPDWASQYQ